jgi:RHS repeat-associated protein
MLGSSRTIVQAGQTSVCFDADFYPFGGERDVTASCAQNYKFEGKERDSETQNDDFGARYYSWRVGRWLSADWSAVPAPVPYANLTNPQTLNLYAMVSDNPETFADLDGHGTDPVPPQPPPPTPPPPPPPPPPAQQAQTAGSNKQGQNHSFSGKQVAKGGTEVAAGAGVLIGILQPEVGLAEVVGGALVSSGLFVKGSSDVMVGSTGGGDTSEMKEAMDVAQSPTKIAVAIANGGNTRQANSVGDVVGGAAAVRSMARNPHGSAVGVAMAAKDMYEGARAAASLTAGGITAYRNITTPPPSPQPPPPPNF